MHGSIFVDTNILVYSKDASEFEKQSRAAEWITHLWNTGTGRLSIQVLSEYYAVVTGKLKPGIEESLAREDIIDLNSWQPLPMTSDLVGEAWMIQDLYHLTWWDSLIVSAAKELRCTHLLSEDFSHDQDFQGLRVVNPFQISPAEL